jgi:hypothetical protein
MIKLNLRDFFDSKNAKLDLDSIRNAAAAAGHPLGALVDDMASLKKTIGDAVNYEGGLATVVSRLCKGCDVELILGHREGVDPEISEKTGYTRLWSNSHFTIAFREDASQPILFAAIDMNVLFADKIYVPSLLRDELIKLGATGWPENVKITPEQVYYQFQEMALGTDYVRMAKEGQWIALVIGDTDAFLESKRSSLFTNQKFGGPGWRLLGSKVVENTYQHHPFDQFTPGMDQSRHPQDQWGHVSNDILIELLNHYALTQVAMFPDIAPRNSLPQGMDLLKLVQLRLGADLMHRGMPGMSGFNQMQNRGYSHGQHFNQPMFRNSATWGNGNAFFTEQTTPQASNGRYTCHPLTGLWVWYPSTPLFVVLNVNRECGTPRETLDVLIRNISENMVGYSRDGEKYIRRMLDEIDVTLDNDPGAMDLLLNDQVTLFVGELSQILPTIAVLTDKYFTNWVLTPGAWNTQKPYTPTKAVNTIEEVAKYIAGYHVYPSGQRPSYF